jgi:hypothetical protein
MVVVCARHLFSTMILCLLVTLLSSCNTNIKFDKAKWDQESEIAIPSPYRDKMLLDLTTNQKLVGLKYNQLVLMLGKPDFIDTIGLAYSVVIDYGHDIDPVYTKNLSFSISKDSIVQSFNIEEFRK